MEERHANPSIMDDKAETVILVDEEDAVLGFGPKLDTHRAGRLHRAFSIFLFDTEGQTLLQKRADTKYHSPGKWANTCCGHPRPGEPIAAAARRRLGEELGVDADLQFGFQARYTADLDQGMTENELVHVFYGLCASAIEPNPSEVSEVLYASLDSVRSGHTVNHDSSAAWLRHYLDHHFDALTRIQNKIAGRAAQERAWPKAATN